MSSDHTTKPDCCADEHLEYLDDLRASGETNMFGARPYLMREFPNLTKDEALAVCMYWMYAPRIKQEPFDNELGKRTTSAATARSHEIPNGSVSAIQVNPADQRGAPEPVANGGDARGASGGCARPTSCTHPVCQCLGVNKGDA